MMARLRQWQSIVNKTLEMIRNNDKVLQYISNSSDEPYNIPVPKWEDVLMKNVFPMPKEPGSVSTEKTFINVYMYGTDIVPENPYYHDDYLYVEVGCHIETWMLKNGEIRPYTICALIDEMFDRFDIPDMSIQKVLPSTYKVLKFGDMFYGYRMKYKCTNIGSMNCG